jgi:UDP-glucose 4-epimerase
MGSARPLNLLITGGSGNLGSWLSRHLAPHHQVTVQSRRAEAWVPAGATRWVADMLDADALRTHLEAHAYDVVIHLASANEFFEPAYAKKALDVNTWGTRLLLDALGTTPQRPHLLYFSTFHVYGKASGTVTEDTPPTPRNDYAASHYFAEHYVRMVGDQHKLPWTIFRLTNSYGAPLWADSSKWYLVLNDLARMAHSTQTLVLKSNGKARRDFIWMGDVCQMAAAYLQQPTPGQVYNLGSGITYDVLHIAQAVQQAYLQHSGQHIPIQVNTADTTDYPALQVDCSRLHQLLKPTLHEAFAEEALAIFRLLETR